MPELRHQYRLYLQASVDDVWRAITDPDWTARYFYGSRLESSLQAGQPFAYTMDGYPGISGEIVEVAPPRRLVQRWSAHFGPDFDNDPPSLVTWEIEPIQGGGTRLTLTHSDFPGENATYRSVADGWMQILLGLKREIEPPSSAAA